MACLRHQGSEGMENVAVITNKLVVKVSVIQKCPDILEDAR
jgi:hypothetical protein